MSVYLDNNATTPVEPEVAEIIRLYTEQEYGNSGSRTHEYGNKAKLAVQKAREQVASVFDGIDSSDVIFTSGATESNNLAILGMLKWATDNGKTHIVTTSIEHKAIIEPVAYAESLGFEVTYVNPNSSGVVTASDMLSAVKDDTFLVSMMHVNNETGSIQPIDEVADALPQQGVYFHTDAAQGYGKELEKLNHPRIDLISISGHKIYGPKGIGALVMRRRKFKRAPLTPIQFGGGQERGLRPGTLPVPLIAGLGVAAECCKKHHSERAAKNRAFRERVFSALHGLDYQVNGDEGSLVSHVLNLSFNGLNSEAVMLALKGIVSISNGSACTSQSYEPSHVLTAMGLSEDRIKSAIRLSWCYMTEEPEWSKVRQAIQSLL
ncbi:cysteine desulfurase DndA [Pontiellaceae bacterium B1224]|nr:cysteine desulfurase DndA [Pontiellaceae bacterium B1224]